MPKTLRFKLEYLKEVGKRHRLALVVFFIACFLGLVLSPKIYSFFDGPRFKTEYYGIISLTTERKLPREITELLSFGLTQKNNLGQFLPSPIVETIQQSSDQKTIRITLKKGINWHNNKTLVAADLKGEFKSLQTTVLDNHTLTIQTPSIVASLPDILSKPILKSDLVGLGEYKIDKIKYQSGFLKEVRLSHVKHQKPNLVYRFYPSTKDAILGLKLAEIDHIAMIEDSVELPTWPAFKIDTKLDFNRYAALYLNTEKLDKKTRQALAYATPKSESKKDRALTSFEPNSWAFSPNVKEYILDAKRAKELFKGNELKNIQILIGNRGLLPQAEVIKNSWRDILGLNVDVIYKNQPEVGDFDTYLTFTSIPDDPDQYSFWHSTQGSNITRINNPLLDKLLEEGRSTTNLQERKKIYAEFQKILLEESPAIFLFYPPFYSISRIK